MIYVSGSAELKELLKNNYLEVFEPIPNQSLHDQIEKGIEEAEVFVYECSDYVAELLLAKDKGVPIVLVGTPSDKVRLIMEDKMPIPKELLPSYLISFLGDKALGNLFDDELLEKLEPLFKRISASRTY